MNDGWVFHEKIPWFCVFCLDFQWVLSEEMGGFFMLVLVLVLVGFLRVIYGLFLLWIWNDGKLHLHCLCYKHV